MLTSAARDCGRYPSTTAVCSHPRLRGPSIRDCSAICSSTNQWINYVATVRLMIKAIGSADSASSSQARAILLSTCIAQWRSRKWLSARDFSSSLASARPTPLHCQREGCVKQTSHFASSKPESSALQTLPAHGPSVNVAMYSNGLPFFIPRRICKNGTVQLGWRGASATAELSHWTPCVASSSVKNSSSQFKSPAYNQGTGWPALRSFKTRTSMTLFC